MERKRIYLDDIIKQKRRRLEEKYKGYNKLNLLEKITSLPERPSFYEAIEKDGLSIIGEIKKASPSKGLIREAFNPIALADSYKNVVDALSVLTEEDYFQGHDKYLRDVSKRVAIPTLCKDFILDDIQLYHAKSLGASCVLLIVAILEDKQLIDFIKLAKKLGMDALVEVHTHKEIERAVCAGAKIIGINNRDLTSFKEDVTTTLRLRPFVPDDCLVVSESGIRGAEEIDKLRDSHIDGILVGESFMRCKDIGEKVKELRDAYET